MLSVIGPEHDIGCGLTALVIKIVIEIVYIVIKIVYIDQEQK